MNYALLLLMLLLTPNLASATAYTSTAWCAVQCSYSSTRSWSPAGVPGVGDTATVSGRHTVVLTTNATVGDGTSSFTLAGTTAVAPARLIVAPGVKLKLNGEFRAAGHTVFQQEAGSALDLNGYNFNTQANGVSGRTSIWNINGTDGNRVTISSSRTGSRILSGSNGQQAQIGIFDWRYATMDDRYGFGINGGENYFYLGNSGTWLLDHVQLKNNSRLNGVGLFAGAILKWSYSDFRDTAINLYSTAKPSVTDDNNAVRRCTFSYRTYAGKTVALERSNITVEDCVINNAILGVLGPNALVKRVIGYLPETKANGQNSCQMIDKVAPTSPGEVNTMESCVWTTQQSNWHGIDLASRLSASRYELRYNYFVSSSPQANIILPSVGQNIIHDNVFLGNGGSAVTYLLKSPESGPNRFYNNTVVYYGAAAEGGDTLSAEPQVTPQALASTAMGDFRDNIFYVHGSARPSPMAAWVRDQFPDKGPVTFTGTGLNKISWYGTPSQRLIVQAQTTSTFRWKWETDSSWRRQNIPMAGYTATPYVFEAFTGSPNARAISAKFGAGTGYTAGDSWAFGNAGAYGRFTGTGHNDALFTGTPTRLISVEVQSPTTFRWRYTNDTAWQAENISMARHTTTPYVLESYKTGPPWKLPATSVKFLSGSGHHPGDQWTYNVATLDKNFGYLDYNLFYNKAYPGDTWRYQGFYITGKDPGVSDGFGRHDIIADPKFRHPTKDTRTFDRDICGGPGTNEHFIAESLKMNNYGGAANSCYTISKIQDYFRNAFTFTTTSLLTAGSTGRAIGARVPGADRKAP